MNIRKPSLMHTIQGEVPELRFFLAMVCEHEKWTEVIRIDRRGGPGWMSDSYRTTFCSDCGSLLSDVKIY